MQQHSLHSWSIYHFFSLQCQIRCSKDCVPETAKHSRRLCNPTTNFTSYSTTCFNQGSQILELTNYLTYPYSIPKSFSESPTYATNSFVLATLRVRPHSLITSLNTSAAKTASSLLEHTRAALSVNKHSDCTNLSNQLPTQLKLHYQTYSFTCTD